MGADRIYGTLDLLILSTLEGDPRHGLGIKRLIEESSNGRINVEVGALYPALRRLEGKGLVRAAWGTSDKGRRARLYRATEKGARHLEDERRRWADHVDAIQSVIQGAT